jgi:hypothetical protein
MIGNNADFSAVLATEIMFGPAHGKSKCYFIGYLIVCPLTPRFLWFKVNANIKSAGRDLAF